MKLVKCKCGGTAKYSGGGMVDSHKCDKCNWETAPYFDGSAYAIQEWNKKNQSEVNNS